MKINNLALSLLLLATLGACKSEGGGSEPPTFDLTCNLNADYTARAEAVTYSATTQPAMATAIILHGKNGTPTRSHFQTLATDLAAAGYDVIAPYMPWSNFVWDGTMCDSMSYIDRLVAQEKDAGKSVILLGHSLAGPIVLAYAALENTTAPDGLLVLAPGHIPHQSGVLASIHASSIAKAKDLSSQGLGTQASTFITSNGGEEQEITATPQVYLSYHDPDEFPDIEASLPLVSTPILWLAGKDDRLTSVMDDNFGIVKLIPNSSTNSYKVVDGDHYTVVESVATELNNWFATLK